MTDIVRLQSLIAEFAGNDHIAPETNSARGASFFAAFSGQEFDAIHMRDRQVVETYGQTSDMQTLAHDMGQEENTEATVFVCSTQNDPNHVLFCGALPGHMIIIRTQSITIDALLMAWNQMLAP